LEKNNIADDGSGEEIKARRSAVLAWHSRVNAIYEGREETSGEER
jgi:hypothetical protein